METIGKRIRSLREKHNMTQTELSEIMGAKTYTTVSKWESGDNSPKGKDIKKLSEIFKVSSDYILGMDGNKNSIDIFPLYNQLDHHHQQKVYHYAEQQLHEQNQVEELPPHYKINVIGKTAAGQPLSFGDPDVTEREFASVPDNADYALIVQGDSMEPDIHDGDIVFYKEQPEIENDEIGIVEMEGSGVICKKVFFDYENKKIVLKSLNEKYEDMVFNDDQIRIIGKVVK